MTQPIQVQLITDLSEGKNTLGIIEIQNTENIDFVKNLGLSEQAIQVAQAHLEKTDIDKKKTLHFYEKIGGMQSILLFFPEKKSLMDERSEFFRGLTESAVFIPASDIDDAYEALMLATYRFQQYLSKKKEFTLSLLVSPDERTHLLEKTPLYEAILWARDMINMPPRDSNPEKMVAEILSKEWNHFDVQVFSKEDLEKMGANLLLAVGAGSQHAPYMVVLVPKNPPKTEKYGLVGKGVTFDAGGIQIKPDNAMLDMKCDMSGAAGVLGVARYMDSLETLPIHMIVAIGLTENMTGGDAFKPLDIYTAYNGATVEIHHTDAEGRLVLADVMSYVEKNHEVDHLITLATLTGACIYALGNEITGIMGDDEDVISTLIANRSPYEPVWRLPLNDKIKKSLKADIADLKNLTKAEKAGSSLGGAFLSYFQGKAKLTHLDIAGPAYRDSAWGYMPKGGTGWGVKILSEFLISQKK